MAVLRRSALISVIHSTSEDVLASGRTCRHSRTHTIRSLYPTRCHRS
ncbi:hypothetical protein ACFPRL_26935 [Pseudoclavibacter helvolus]